MALTIRLTPGAVVTANDLWTVALLNAIANPTIELEGSVSSLALADGSVTTAKLQDGALAASAAGRAKMADAFLTLAKILDGIFTADAPGRAKFANGFVSGALIEESTRAGVAQYSAGVQAATVYAVTLSPAATAYTAGMVVRFKADSANVAGVSVNVNTLGNKALKRCHSSGLVDLAANDIITGQMISAVYDGTVFQVLNECAGVFVSAELAIAAGIVGDVAHGLGAAPSMLHWVLVCKTGELGYSVGDEVDISFPCLQGATDQQALQGGASSTKVWLMVRNTAIQVLNKGTGAPGNMTAANWRAKCYATL